MPRRRLDPAARREQLLDAAARCFADHGPGVSTRDIARAAGVSEALLFHYFPDKESLWIAVASRAGTFAGGLFERVAEPGTAGSLLDRLPAAYAAIRAEERQIVAILLGAALRDEPLGARVREAQAGMVVSLAEALAVQGLAPAGPEAEAAATALIGAFVLDLIIHHRDPPERWAPRAAAFAAALVRRLRPHGEDDVRQLQPGP